MVIILHLGLVFISFTVGITYVVDFYDIKMVSVTFVVVITLIILWVMQMLMKHKM